MPPDVRVLQAGHRMSVASSHRRQGGHPYFLTKQTTYGRFSLNTYSYLHFGRRLPLDKSTEKMITLAYIVIFMFFVVAVIREYRK